MVQEHGRELLVLQTTLPDERQAAALAEALVAARLAACVQATPIRSVYRWEGRIERAGEVRLDVKTMPERLDALIACLRARHPYDEPEIVVLRAAASPGYADWARAETGGA